MRVRALVVPVAVGVALAGCAVIQRSSVALVGEPNGASVEAALSADGSVQAFASTATNLVPGDRNGVADVYVRDALDHVSRVSVSSDGTEGDGPSSHPSVSADGRYVAFQSDATNLVPNDTNATTDVFVRDRVANTTTLVSVPAPGAPAAAVAAVGSVSAAPGPSPTAPNGSSAASAAAFHRTTSAALRARATITPQRVIIRTATTFHPEAKLSAPARASQRRTIHGDQDAVGALIGSDGQVTARARTLPIVVATVDAAALDRLDASPTVTGVMADDPVPAALVNSGPVVGLPAVQDAQYTGRGEAVAILDTGVDSTHPFLGNRIVDEACYSAAGSCPNGTATQTGPGSAAPCTYAPNGCRHGTHVAGIAAGSALDATGVAPRASIIAVQVFSRIDNTTFCNRGENPCPLTFPSDWILALEHVYELRDTYKIAAANMSIGGISVQAACDTDVVKPAVDQLRAVGIATVVAAGNEGLTDSIDYPACISSTVSVGATDDADNIASFSNSHPEINLFAPGVNVRSSVPGGGFANFNGTSMATPHVTGAFALAKEQHPNATVDEIVAAMRSTGRVIHDARNGTDTPRLCTSGALGFDRCPNHNGSRWPSISANGQSVAFESDAPLVPLDTNGVTDVFVRAIVSATTTRVSVASGGTQGSRASTHPALAGSGTRVAFDSLAPELIAGDTNGVSDVFVRDLPGGITARISTAAGAVQGAGPSRDAAISADGTAVAYATDNAFVAADTNTLTDVYVGDLSNGTTSLASVATDGTTANGRSRHPSLDSTGRFVAFESDATNLVGEDTNQQTDVFVRDRSSVLTQRASASFFGGQATAFSAGVVTAPTGGALAMTSAASDLVGSTDTNGAFDVYRRALVTPQITGFSGGPIARGTSASFTIAGRGFVAPAIVTSDAGITLNVATLSPTTIIGTVSVAANATPGAHTINVINLSAAPGLFSATLFPAVLTVT